MTRRLALIHSRPQNRGLQAADRQWPLSIPPKEPRALARVGSIFMVISGIILSQGIISFAATDKITRIELKTSGSVDYESRFMDNPARLIIKFKSHGVFGNLLKDAEINEGLIKKVEVTYYPLSETNMSPGRIKFLTFWLDKGASYKVWSKENNIFVDFKSASPVPAPREIEISEIIDVKEENPEYGAARFLLSLFIPKNSSETVAGNSNLWILVVLLIAIYIMYIRPESWRRMLDRIVNPEAYTKPTFFEKRRWWRHNLLPVKNKNLYVRLDAPETGTKLKLMPVDIGYGGMCLSHSILKKLKGELKIKLFMPDRMLPVELKGNIAWQRNSWNPLKRLAGISFIGPPEKDWAGINSYIESRYVALTR